jgi:hypothetical protein
MLAKPWDTAASRQAATFICRAHMDCCTSDRSRGWAERTVPASGHLRLDLPPEFAHPVNRPCQPRLDPSSYSRSPNWPTKKPDSAGISGFVVRRATIARTFSRSTSANFRGPEGNGAQI